MLDATITGTFPQAVSIPLTTPPQGAFSVGQVWSNGSEIVPLGPGDALTLNAAAPSTAAIAPAGLRVHPCSPRRDGRPSPGASEK